MKKRFILAVLLACGIEILQARPVSACCFGRLDTYGGCNYWEICPSGSSTPSPAPSTSVPAAVPPPDRRTHYSDGTPYLNDGQYYRVVVTLQNGGQLNIRSGPGLGYPIVDAIANNTLISITGGGVGQGQQRWMQLPNGNWINATYLAPPYDLALTDPDRGRIQNVITGTN